MANFFKRLAGMPYIGNLLKQSLDDAFDATSGHTHDGTAGNGGPVAGTTPADGSITNAKLADDVKVGSLAALTTTVKTSVQAAINELVTSIGSLAALTTTVKTSCVAAINELVTSLGSLAALTTTVKTSAVAAINELVTNLGSLAALTTTVKTSAVAAINELVTSIAAKVTGSGGNIVIGAQITLIGANPTTVNFQGGDAAATITGSADETFALDNGLTLVVNPDGAGDDTVTFAAAAGTSKSGDTASANMSASLDTKIAISVDGGAAQTVTFDWATGDGGGPCDSGLKIAAEMQEKIQALGGAFAAVTVAFDVDHYLITSGTKGTASAVVVTRAADHNATEELELGPDGAGVGGAETAGTGDAANIAAATAAEVAAAITAKATGWSATAVGTKVRIDSATTGSGSSLVVNAGSTADLILGITGSAYGQLGLGLAANMANTNYRVSGTFVKDGAGVTDTWSVGNKAVGSFRIYCETAGNTEKLDLTIFGTLAA